MILRFFGYIFLCIAVAAFAYDGTQMIADNGRLTFTSVEEHWINLSLESMEGTREVISGINSYLWSPVLMTILVLPAWMVSGGLGVLLYLSGYRPPRADIPDGI